MYESVTDFIARMDRGEMDGHLTDAFQALSHEDLIKVCEVLMGALSRCAPTLRDLSPLRSRHKLRVAKRAA